MTSPDNLAVLPGRMKAATPGPARVAPPRGVAFAELDESRTLVDLVEPTMDLVELTTVWTPAGLPVSALDPGAAPAPQSAARAQGLLAARKPRPDALAPRPPAVARGSGPASLGLSAAVEREIFQLARRIALQTDLPAAMRVLQRGLSQLTGSSSAICIFFDPAMCSAWTIPDGKAERALDDKLQQLVAQVAGSGRRAVLERALLEPVGTVPARAVLMVQRAPGGPAYGGVEIATLAALATAMIGLVGHFATEHAARREQELRDAKSPFRPEALAANRGAAAAPGRLVTTPRNWIRWTYPALLGLVAAVLVAAAIVQVPTYSTGVSIIMMDGEQITSPTPGTVAEVLVVAGAQVAAGEPVLRLHSHDEEAELVATETDYRNALATFLSNPGDDATRNALAMIATRRQRAKAVVDARTLRAPTSGIVGDVRVRTGQLVTPGAQIMKISSSAQPSVVALLPGFDRPRLAPGMTLQIDLPGYHKKREQAVIDTIASQVVSAQAALRSLGDPVVEALQIAGTVVIVRARLTARTFKAGGRQYAFHDGMTGKAEVRVDRDSLLRMLLPGKDE